MGAELSDQRLIISSILIFSPNYDLGMFLRWQSQDLKFFVNILVRILETSHAVENKKSETQAPEHWVGVIFLLLDRVVESLGATYS
jgi:hypothetical protein